MDFTSGQNTKYTNTSNSVELFQFFCNSRTMSLWMYIAGAVAVYLLFVLLKKIYRIFRECFLIYNIAIGGREDRRKLSKGSRLHVYVCNTKLLDELSVKEIFTFCQTVRDTSDSVAQFQKLLLSYKYIILCRERIDGSLRGTLLLDIRDEEIQGQNVKLFRLEIAYMHKQYQGGPQLYLVGAYLLLKEMLLHPLTPVYMAGKAFSYKSYLMGTRLFPNNFYPQYNAETPEFEQALIHKFAELVRKPGDVYRPETGVLEQEMAKIKDFVVAFSEKDLENPHIKFFNDRNPGWLKGHQMIGVGKVTWKDLFKMVLFSFKRSRSGRKGLPKKSATSPISPKKQERFLSYQSEDAQAYAMKHSNELRSIRQESFVVSPESNSKTFRPRSLLRRDSMLNVDSPL